MSRVAVVTEGGTGIGLGHVMESAHVISALDRLGIETSCLGYGPRPVRSVLDGLGVGVSTLTTRLGPETAAALGRRIRRAGTRVVFCNVMRLEETTVTRLRAAGLVVTAIVEGQGPTGLDQVFDVVARPELMVLSPRLARRRPPRRPAISLLLTMGGVDARGLTPRLIRWLGGMTQPPDLRVVVGALFDHHEALKRAVERYPVACRVDRAPPQDRLFRMMRASRAAIAHGGDTLYELACLGVPTAVVCPTVRQLRVADRFAGAAAVLNLGVHRTLTRSRFQRGIIRLLRDTRLRRCLRTAGPRLVDGRGAQRVARTLAELAAA